MTVIAPAAPTQVIPPDLLRPVPVRMEQISVSHSLAAVAPAYWATLTPEEQRLLRHVRIIAGGLLVKVNPPILPQQEVSPEPGPITGLSLTVLAGGNVQAAWNQAAAADPDLHHEVILEEGVTFVGNLLIPPKRGPGRGWITVRSRALAALPSDGERIARVHAPLMPKLVSPNLVAAVAWNDAPNSEGWRFVGIESMPSSALGNDTGSVGSPGALQLWWFGWNGTDPTGNGTRRTQADLDKRPRRAIIDRCYIHPARDKQYVQRAVTINLADVRVCGSIIHGQGAGQDCQGLWCYVGGGGPKLIENNEILGTGQNLFFGGSGSGDPAVFEQEQPQDVIVRRNWMHKLDRWNPAHPTWDGINWTVKPIIEIKEIGVARCLIEGNLLENAFAWGPIHWSTHSAHDVTVQYNVTRNCGSLGTIWDTSGLQPNVDAGRLGIRRIKYWHNLFEANPYAVPTRGPDTGWLRILPVSGNTQDLWVEHNTFMSGGAWGIAGTGLLRSRFANNVFGYGNGGVTHEGDWLWRDADWDARGFADRDWVQNAYVNLGNIVKDPERANAATPWAPASSWYVPFTQAGWSSAGGVATGQFIVAGTAEEAALSILAETFGQLGATSPLTSIGVDFDNKPDGSALGVDFAALAAAQTLAAPGDPLPLPTPDPVPVPPPDPGVPNSAAIISLTVPSEVVAGAAFTATLRFKNTGTLTWVDTGEPVPPGKPHRLGSQEPQDNLAWGPKRLLLPVGVTVPPGGEIDFSATFTAPLALGPRPFAWRMVQDLVAWFGPIARAVITVVAVPTPAPDPDPIPEPPPAPVPPTVDARLAALEAQYAALIEVDRDLVARIGQQERTTGELAVKVAAVDSDLATIARVGIEQGQILADHLARLEALEAARAKVKEAL